MSPPSPPPETSLASALAEAAPLRAVHDALSTGIVLHDAEDRLVFSDAEFRRLCPRLAPHRVPGRSFEDPLRQATALGELPRAATDPEAWHALTGVANRRRFHRVRPLACNRTGQRGHPAGDAGLYAAKGAGRNRSARA